MNASTAYKIKLARDALKHKLSASVTIRGVGSYRVAGVRDVKHSVILTVANSGGFIAVAPDDIVSVWVNELPPAFEESQPHA